MNRAFRFQWAARPVRPAPPQNFTGTAHVEMLFEAVDPSHASAGMVTFEPGARNGPATKAVVKRIATLLSMMVVITSWPPRYALIHPAGNAIRK